MGARAGLIFVVDDDTALSALVAEWLREAGYAVSCFETGEACLRALTEAASPSAVLLDLNMPGQGGMVTLERLKALYRHLPVIVLTGDKDVATVVATIQKGAYDFLPKPVDKTKLTTTLANAVEKHSMAVRLAELERDYERRGFPGLVGQSPQMREVARQIERVAGTDVTVLIHGESGTGKELVARAIHEHSGQQGQQFIALNCAALPETLQEAELFGYEKGAFTGAAGRRVGRFEQVAGGTMFLDEVAELSPTAQSKLLRVLQERVVQRLGSNEDVQVDFRLVTATHRDLAEEVKKGRFREDLYFRIVVFELELPPLRFRDGDVRVLTRHFIEKHGARLINAAPDIDPDALMVMLRHSWPGNVRELENTLQRALVSCDRAIIRKADSPPRMVGDAVGAADSMEVDSPVSAPGAATASGSAMTLEQAERQLIRTALERCNGNRSMVAQQLGIGRTTLYRKLKEYGLE